MVLSVKNKIRLGTSFLFLLLIITGGISIYNTSRLKNEARKVLQDNYETLSYCHKMLQQLDSLQISFALSVDRFEKALVKQENNITEPGEENATKAVRNYFNKLKSGDTTNQNLRNIQKEIQAILALNMSAIQNKNASTQKTAENALGIIISLAAAVFLIALTFSINFPSVVTTPISKLSEAIKQISNKNYKHRIHIDNRDEFGNLANAFNEMAERLQYFESSNLNKLLFEKSRAEAVINSLKDASIGIDKNNNILFVNHQALLLLGLKSEQIVGKSTEEVSRRNDLFNYLVNNDATTPFKIVVDNRENYFVKETIEVEQGETRSKVIVLRNITSFKELDVAKTNFIATISHELKTPLAASDFSLKLLEDERVGNLSNEQKELIKNLKQDNQRMLKILSELLNMSQVEAGRIQLKINDVNPSAIITNAIQAVQTSAKEKGIVIKANIDKDIPLIKADAEKTTWVINNFLTNAIKYSSYGNEVNVSISSQNSSVIFSVSDHGPGIAQEYQSRLFERYFQVPGSKAKGTGLGLAISKEFIEAQGGKIWLKSEIGQGSTFSFQLPSG